MNGTVINLAYKTVCGSNRPTNQLILNKEQESVDSC